MFIIRQKKCGKWKKCGIRGKIIMNEMFELEGASLTVHLPG